jgi:orotate phosphoribosyltransferase-like protein
MALKSDRLELQTDISFFYNAGTATRGCVVVHDTAGSGAAMDQGVNLVKKHTAGVPVGILLNDVVNKDLTRTHLNQHKDEVQKGGKVTVLRKGYVVTNDIDTTQNPVAGSGAYASGGTAGAIAMTGTYQVGRFLSSKDEDGYAKVEVNLP